MKNKKAFTIVELVIVIAVVAILAAVLIPTFSKIINKAKASYLMQNDRNSYIESMANAILDNETNLEEDQEADPQPPVEVDSPEALRLKEIREDFKDLIDFLNKNLDPDTPEDDKNSITWFVNNNPDYEFQTYFGSGMVRMVYIVKNKYYVVLPDSIRFRYEQGDPNYVNFADLSYVQISFLELAPNDSNIPNTYTIALTDDETAVEIVLE